MGTGVLAFGKQMNGFEQLGETSNDRREAGNQTVRIKTNKKTVNNRIKQSGTTFNNTKVNKTAARFHVSSKASSMDVLGLKTPHVTLYT